MLYEASTLHYRRSVADKKKEGEIFPKTRELFDEGELKELAKELKSANR